MATQPDPLCPEGYYVYRQDGQDERAGSVASLVAKHDTLMGYFFPLHRYDHILYGGASSFCMLTEVHPTPTVRTLDL